MPDLADLYPGFASRWIATAAGRMFARTGGEGPPLLLLHGYPQTNVMWHRVAPALARHFSLIIPDLPGYGWSDAPQADAEHAPYTKRAMANAMIAVMEALGHARFRLAGHDRGGRVAYRLALDHPGRLERLAVLDIVPTWAMWHNMDARLANRAWHWMFLALPAPFPETLIGKDPLFYFDTRAAAGTKSKSLAAFDPRALAHYHAFFNDPLRIHATCEDYRAGRTTDLAHDEESPRQRRQDHLSPAGDLGRRRRHPVRDRRAARDLAGMGERRARISARLRALSRRGGARRDSRGADRVLCLKSVFGDMEINESDRLGLLPPPLAGEGWGGGGLKCPAVWRPLPVPPPQAGEGTMWQHPSHCGERWFLHHRKPL